MKGENIMNKKLSKKLIIIIGIITVLIIVPLVSFGIIKIGSSVKLVDYSKTNTVNQNEIKANIDKNGGIYTGTNISYSKSTQGNTEGTITSESAEEQKLREQREKDIDSVYIKFDSARFNQIMQELEEDKGLHVAGKPTDAQLQYCYLTLDILDNCNLNDYEKELMKGELDNMYIYTKDYPDLRKRFDSYLDNP